MGLFYFPCFSNIYHKLYLFFAACFFHLLNLFTMAWNPPAPINKMPSNPNGNWIVQETPNGFSFIDRNDHNKTIPCRPEQAVAFLAEQINDEIRSTYWEQSSKEVS
jgi:hypothetical protein